MSDNFSVLLVDDDPDTCALFQDALEHFGITLRTAGDGVSTLSDLQENSAPDVIVLDIFLPDTDGYRLLQTIRALPEHRACPIIAITGYYTTDTMGDLQKYGFDGYMLKPLDPVEIVKYLQKLVA
jgi:CheY-like chemotaxis protein